MAEAVYDAVAFSNLRTVDERRGIANPTAARAALEAWVPGTVAPALAAQGVARHSGRDAGVAVIGIEPGIEERVSSIAEDFVQGSFRSLEAGGNNVVIFPPVAS